MGDEASGGSERLPSNLAGEVQGEGGSDSDDSSHTPAQSVAERPSVQRASMADRDRRSRVERGPSNIPTSQSRNSLQQQQQRRHDDPAGNNVPEARNRHRDRTAPSTGRQSRPAPSSSANQRPPAAAAAAAEPEAMDDDTDEARYCLTPGDVKVVLTEDLTLLPILQTDFAQLEQRAASPALNWQVCFSVSTFNYGKILSQHCS